jgi:hypothetical protein
MSLLLRWPCSVLISRNLIYNIWFIKLRFSIALRENRTFFHTEVKEFLQTEYNFTDSLSLSQIRENVQGQHGLVYVNRWHYIAIYSLTNVLQLLILWFFIPPNVTFSSAAKSIIYNLSENNYTLELSREWESLENCAISCTFHLLRSNKSCAPSPWT